MNVFLAAGSKGLAVPVSKWHDQRVALTMIASALEVWSSPPKSFAKLGYDWQFAESG